MFPDSACDMPSFAPCLHEEADTRIFARSTEAAKRPNKKISSCAVDTDVRGLSQKVVDFCYNTRLCVRNSMKFV